MNYKDKLWIQGLILFIPLFMIIDGMIEMNNKSIYHSDTFVLFGLLIMGIISLINVLITFIKIMIYGWKNLSIYDKCMFVFYLIWFIPTFVLWSFLLVSLFNF